MAQCSPASPPQAVRHWPTRLIFTLDGASPNDFNMLTIIIFFLFAALLLYVVFAGADFGAGILELFSAKGEAQRRRHITYHAIGPVWEANHIWIILIIVILFNGFPKVYSTISTYLHIPLLMMLVGIIFRGTTFAFRHYDAIKDDSQTYYSTLFAASSLLTPLFLGTIAGATILGRIDPNPQTLSFYYAYLSPWLNGFSFSVGLLFCAISAFTAAVFLVGEAEKEIDKQHFIRLAKWSNISLVLIGFMVLVIGQMSGLELLQLYILRPIAWISVLFATFAVPALWYALKKSWYWLARLLAGFQITMILLAWIGVQFPVIIRLANGQYLSLYDTLAPPIVQKVLVVCLIVGGLLIFPALYYLFRVFKIEKEGVN